MKVFRNDEIGPGAVLASACLPLMFQAVEIGASITGRRTHGQRAYGCDSRDVAIVDINPLQRTKLPTTPGEIINHINEISFNSALTREMRAIALVTRLNLVTEK